MRPISRSIWVVSVVVAVIGVGAWRALAASDAALCANTVLQTIPDSMGGSRAVIFERDCGATTGFSTQVAVLGSDENGLDTIRNAFIADDDHGRAPTDVHGALPLQLRWVGVDTLEIRYDRRARVFRRSPRVGHVWVRAAPIEAPGA